MLKNRQWKKNTKRTITKNQKEHNAEENFHNNKHQMN